MLELEDGERLAAVGFISPIRLPSFVIPAFVVWKSTDRLQGIVGRRDIYIQDECSEGATKFVRVLVDERTRTVRLRNSTIEIALQTGRTAARTKTITIRDGLYFVQLGRGERLYAFADSEGKVIAGHRWPLARILFERFLQDEGFIRTNRFLTYELARFTRDFEFRQIQEQMSGEIMGRIEGRIRSDQYGDVLQRVEASQELTFGAYASDE